MGLCSQPAAPDPNPGLIASSQASERIAGEQLQLGRDQFEWGKTQADADRQFLAPLINQQISIGNANEARAQNYFDYEQQTFRPLEQGIVRDAQEFDTAGTRERLRREAGANVEAQMAQAKETTARDISRAGGNAASGNFTDAFSRMNTAGGLARVREENNAETQATGLGHAMKMDAAGLGRNLSSNASTAYGIALNANQGAQASTMGQTAQESGLRTSGQGWYGGAQAGYNGAIGGYGTEYKGRLDAYGTGMQGYGATMGMVGQLGGAAMGMMADGGPVNRNKARGVVRGPGTGISDSIPARLSDGEFVIPADVVKVKGTEFFNKLLEKHHTPAGVQRKMGVR